MIRFSSRWLVVPAVAVAVVAVVFAEPRNDVIQANDLEHPTAPSDPTEREAARLHQQKQEMFTLRISYKESLINHLIVGKTTLEAVADEFLRLNRETPITLAMIANQYPDCNDEEASALNAIEYARMRVDFETGDAVIERLKAEFRKLYGREYRTSH